MKNKDSPFTVVLTTGAEVVNTRLGWFGAAKQMHFGDTHTYKVRASSAIGAQYAALVAHARYRKLVHQCKPKKGGQNVVRTTSGVL